MTRSHNHKIWDTNWQQHINTSHFHLKVNTVRGSPLLLLYSYTPYNSLEKNTFLYFYERRKLTLNGEMSVQRYVIRAPQNEGSTYVEPQRNVPWIIHVVQMTAKETNRAAEWACKVRYGATSQPLHTHIRPHTQFVILINFMNFLTNFNLTTCTFQYIHK